MIPGLEFERGLACLDLGCDQLSRLGACDEGVDDFDLWRILAVLGVLEGYGDYCALREGGEDWVEGLVVCGTDLFEFFVLLFLFFLIFPFSAFFLFCRF